MNSFSVTLLSDLSKNHLLKHPFYQAWNEGCIPMEKLRLYAKQYYQHVSAFPRYVSATHAGCESIQARQVLLENLIDEERGVENHPELWLRFAEGLGCNRKEVEAEVAMPETAELVRTFIESAKRSYAEGLGVLFAYEHQVPEIATFKLEALRKHYGIDQDRSVSFFKVHQSADVYHTQEMASLIDQLSPADQALARHAALQPSQVLWKFLDGIAQAA